MHLLWLVSSFTRHNHLHVRLLWIVSSFTRHNHPACVLVMNCYPIYASRPLHVCTCYDFLPFLHDTVSAHMHTYWLLSSFTHQSHCACEHSKISLYIYKSKPHRACALVYDPQARANVTVTAHVHKATSAYVVTCCGCWVVQMCISKLGNNSLCRSDSLKICFPLNLLMCNGVRNVHTWPNCHLYVGRVTRLLNPDDHIVKGCTWIPHPDKAKM